MSDVKSVIESGRAVLGIEFGSTRIKAVLIGEDQMCIRDRLQAISGRKTARLPDNCEKQCHNL